jgi:DNA-binding FadR family transcriptional regulator
MQTTAMAPAYAAPTSATGKIKHRSDQPSLFKRVLAAMIAGQEARARKAVHAHLSRLDGPALARLGWTPDDIAQLRRNA